MMAQFHPNHKKLVLDLLTITNSIPESYFIDAALAIRPFKPETKDLRQSQAMRSTIDTINKTS